LSSFCLPVLFFLPYLYLDCDKFQRPKSRGNLNNCRHLHVFPLVWSGSKTFKFICFEVTCLHFRYFSFISSFPSSLFSSDTSFPRSDSGLQFRIHECSFLHIELKNVSCGTNLPASAFH
jgi:hypothetical protein